MGWRQMQAIYITTGVKHTLRESSPSTRTVNTLLFDESPLTVINDLGI